MGQGTIRALGLGISMLTWGVASARAESQTPAQVLDPIPLVGAVYNARGLVCSGVLVGPRHLLTARHCGDATQVAFGPTITAPTRVVAVERIERPSFAIDAEILRLREPVSAPSFAALWTEAEAPKGTATVVGFGATDPEGTRGAGVRHTRSARVEEWGCTPERAAILGCLPGFEMVLTRQSGGDSCRGDSGGPVFFATPTGPKLVAIVSRATNEASTWCGDGGVYVRVDRLAGWIERTVEGR